jgi:hypothetical protein
VPEIRIGVVLAQYIGAVRGKVLHSAMSADAPKDYESRIRNAARAERLFINHTLPVDRKSLAISIVNRGSLLICSTCGALERA